ncbi:MAG: O-antigen ligase family protein [Kiritimatiellia bacterium]
MNWFVRNVLVVHVLALVMAFSWIQGGTRAELLVPVIPWLAALTLQFLIVFPQAKSTETLMDARERVWRALRRDPLVYLSLLLLALLIIPLFNVAPLPVFDEAAQRWVNAPPPVAWLPFCTSPDSHAVLFLWFPPALIAALSARHGLLKRGKRLLLELICWNGALLAVIGFAQVITETKELLWFVPLEAQFFSTFGYPNFAGAFFTLIFAISAGLWMYEATLFMHSKEIAIIQSEKNFFTKHRLFAAMALNFIAALATLSRAAILLAALVFIILGLYLILFIWERFSKVGQIKIVTGIVLLFMLAAATLTLFDLKEFKGEIHTLSYDTIVSRVTGGAYYHVRVAQDIYRDYPVFGVGGWGYPIYQSQYMSPAEIKGMQIVGGANVHNDTWQFLAEQGYVGFGLLMACVLALLAPLWLSLFQLISNSFQLYKKDVDRNLPSAHWFYCIPLPLIAVFVGTAATVCHSLGDLPFRNPAVLTIWVLALACVPGWLPLVRRSRFAP